MELVDAVQLISHPAFSTQGRLHWADLGCGSGTFTQALASLLQQGSTLVAVDSDQKALGKIPASFGQVPIRTQLADFTKNEWQTNPLDGVLMANSLHFVKDKIGFLASLKMRLTTNACFLVVEYETNKANPWVPYPIGFKALSELYSALGYQHIIQLNTRPSVYGNNHLYSALIY